MLMSNTETLIKFKQLLTDSISSNKFVKLSLGNYKGNDKELKNLYIKPVVIKRNNMLSFNYRYKTRDIFKNQPVEEGVKLIENLLSNDFKIGTLFTSSKEVIVEHNKKGD